MPSSQPGASATSAASAADQPATEMANQPDMDDKTAPHPDQEGWSITNLPDILNVGPVFGKMLRNLPVLPNRISSHVEGWRLETWMRLDRRITSQDIIDRVNPLFRVNINDHDVEYRRHLFRQKFHIAYWGNQKSMNEICRMVKYTGRDPKLNSTRGLTPGLISPAEGEAGGRIPLPPTHPMHNAPGPGGANGVHDQPAPPLMPPNHNTVVPKYPGQYVFSCKNRDGPADTSDSHTPVNGDNQALNQPELKIQYETPSKAKSRAADEPAGVPRKEFVAQPDSPDSQRKRKVDIGTADIFGRISRAKRMRQHPDAIPSFPKYPRSALELASYEGPPARSFPGPLEPEPDHAMSLDEYLETNNLGYLDFLNARYYDEVECLDKHRAGALD